jgi:predicted dehydrogenase
VTQPVRIGLIGTGWRADFYLRLAAALPSLEIVAVSTRDATRGREIETAWSLPTTRTPGELIDSHRPDFVVASVPRAAMPSVIGAVASKGVAVLAETPPATDLASMQELWAGLERPELVQVAEQYPYLPRFQAYDALIAAGWLGTVTSAQLSWTHGYHAVALLRKLLGVGFRDVRVAATAFRSPTTRSLGRDGWPADSELIEAEQMIATLDFGDRLGVYDFTDGQWFHPLMSRRSVVRGTTGEIVNDVVTRLVDPRTPVSSSMARRQTGVDGDLEGSDLDTISLDGEILYRNPYRGLRLSDEEIAIASMLEQLGSWLRHDGAPPYPLAEACQDQLIALAIDEAAASSSTVTIGRQSWSTPAT